MKTKWKELIISVLISVGVGGLAGILTKDSMEVFRALEKPPLTPPGWVFPIVWTILFIMMGVAAYLVYTSGEEGKTQALILYGIQLALNFVWTLVFFNQQAYLDRKSTRLNSSHL